MDTAMQLGIVYCILSIVCGIVLFANAQMISATTLRYSYGKYLYYSCLCASFSSLASFSYGLRELGVLAFNVQSAYFWTALSILFTGLHLLFWVCYSEIKQRSWFTLSLKRFIIFLIPFVIVLILISSSPFTDLFFYFENQKFQMGSLYIPLSAVVVAYISYTGIAALIRSFEPEHYADRTEYRLLFGHALFSILIQVIQKFVPIMFPYGAVGTMMIFNIMLKARMIRMITYDPLTHLNNRHTLDHYLSKKMSEGNAFGFTMVDVDHLGKVCNIYGHSEGDTALMCVAEALTKAVPESYFISRLGGDDFAIVGGETEDDLAPLEEAINTKLAAVQKEHKCSFRVEISAGYAIKDDTVRSIPALMEKARKKLFWRKEEKKEKK